MFKIEYYKRPNGKQPVAEWLDSLSVNLKAVIYDKIQVLEENGLELLGTGMMARIKDGDPDFYELKGGQCRVALHYNRSSNVFVLLYGFLKKRAREKREVAKARSLLHEYLST